MSAATAAPPPSGMVPLMISGKEMEKYELKAGPGIKETVEFKCFSKEYILDDIQSVGFYSSFHGFRKEIAAFPGEEILIVADKEEKYGENWVLCLSMDAFEGYMENLRRAKEEEELALKHAQDDEERRRKEEQDALNVVYEDKPIVAREWNSDTIDDSHEEVKQLTIRCNRPLLMMTITRPRKDNNSSYKFSDRDADQSLAECRQHKDPNYELSRMEQDVALQAIPELCERGTQTSWFRAVNSSIQYEPICMDISMRLDNLESVEMLEFLESALGQVEEVLQQNETLDIFMDEFSNLVEDDAALGNKSENNIKELRTFTDLEYSKNKILPAVDWHPRKKGVVAVAASANVTFDQRVEMSDKVDTSYLLIWNFADLIHPQLMLESPHDTYTFRFNPTQPHLIAAGSLSGQVILWNVAQAEELLARKKNKTVANNQDDEDGDKVLPPVKHEKISHIDSSHRRPVADLTWLPAGFEVTHRGNILQTNDTKSYQFLTIAGDGQVCFWDIRGKDNPARKAFGPAGTRGKEGTQLDSVWTPFYKLALTKLEGVGELSLCRFSLEEMKQDPRTEDPAKVVPSSAFYCATEEGEIVCADWKPHVAGSNDDDDNDVAPDYVHWISQDHFRPCVALQRCPFFKDVLLSVGDWSFNLWKEGVNQPIFSSPLASAYLTSGRWSPTRPGVLMVGKSDGSIDVWDLLDQSHRPSTTVAIAPSEITSMEFWNNNAATAKQQLLAVGDANGNLHILDIPRNLWRQMHNERSIMESFFIREVKRVEYVKERTALRDAEKETQENNDDKSNALKEVAVKHEVHVIVKEKAEEEYKALEAAFREELGID